MQYGFCLPNTMDGDELCRFAQKAEELGFESVWIGDHIVLPTASTNQYPYTADGSFSRPHEAPFLETLTVLAFVAACTSSIRIGSTVVIVPYRNPVLQAKIFASLDVLSKGRAVCGVGVGWLEKEFETLDVPYSERGPMTNEWLEIFTNLWTEEVPSYSGATIATTAFTSSRSPFKSRAFLYGSVGTRAAPCAAPPSTATHGIPRGRRRSMLRAICLTYMNRSRQRGAARTRSPSRSSAAYTSQTSVCPVAVVAARLPAAGW